MEERDAEAVARVHVRSWQAAYRRQLPDGYLDGLSTEIERRTAFWRRWITGAPERKQTLLVAEEGVAVLGFVTHGPPQDAAPGPGVGELYAIYLHPDAWGKRVGRALMDAAVRGLTDDGYREAILWVLETNARARRFYEIAGWAVEGATKTEQRGDVELREVRYRRILPARRSS